MRLVEGESAKGFVQFVFSGFTIRACNIMKKELRHFPICTIYCFLYSANLSNSFLSFEFKYMMNIF